MNHTTRAQRINTRQDDIYEKEYRLRVRKAWRKEAVTWLRAYRKSNFYSHWELYQTAKRLAVPA